MTHLKSLDALIAFFVFSFSTSMIYTSFVRNYLIYLNVGTKNVGVSSINILRLVMLINSYNIL